MYRVNSKWLYLLPPSKEGTAGTVIPGWQNTEITFLYHSNSMKTSRNTHVLQKKQALRAIGARSARLELNQYLSTVGLHQKCHVWHEPLDLQESLLTSKLKNNSGSIILSFYGPACAVSTVCSINSLFMLSSRVRLPAALHYPSHSTSLIAGGC